MLSIVFLSQLTKPSATRLECFLPSSFIMSTPNVGLFNGVVMWSGVWNMVFWSFFGSCTTTCSLRHLLSRILWRFWCLPTSIFGGFWSWWNWRLRGKCVVDVVIKLINNGINCCIRNRPEASKGRVWWCPKIQGSIRILIIFRKKVKARTVSEAFREYLCVSGVFYAVSEENCIKGRDAPIWKNLNISILVHFAWGFPNIIHHCCLEKLRILWNTYTGCIFHDHLEKWQNRRD